MMRIRKTLGMRGMIEGQSPDLKEEEMTS